MEGGGEASWWRMYIRMSLVVLFVLGYCTR